LSQVKGLLGSAAAQLSGRGGFYQKGAATPRRVMPKSGYRFSQDIMLNSLKSIMFMSFDRLDRNAS
jgi:hypothetical protein